MAKSYI